MTIPRIIKLLEQLEWSQWRECHKVCPSCQNAFKYGHTEGCELEAAIHHLKGRGSRHTSALIRLTGWLRTAADRPNTFLLWADMIRVSGRDPLVVMEQHDPSVVDEVNRKDSKV